MLDVLGWLSSFDLITRGNPTTIGIWRGVHAARRNKCRTFCAWRSWPAACGQLPAAEVPPDAGAAGQLRSDPLVESLS